MPAPEPGSMEGTPSEGAKTAGSAPTRVGRESSSTGQGEAPRVVSERARGEPAAALEGMRSSPSVGPRKRILITVPARNEVTRLGSTLEAIDAAFRRAGLDFCLAVAEDGSTDGTKELLRRLPERWPSIRIQEDGASLGRGRALRQLWATTEADVYCFTDADLAAGADALVTAVQGVLSGLPIVVGSRYADGARTLRPPVRSIVSRAYNWILRVAFREGIRDHQCGLKAFSSEVIHDMLSQTEEDSWFWDTEILVLALYSGYPVAELPVPWIERKFTRTHYRRLLSDVLLHGGGVIRLKARVTAPAQRFRSHFTDAAILRLAFDLPVHVTSAPERLSVDDAARGALETPSAP